MKKEMTLEEKEVKQEKSQKKSKESRKAKTRQGRNNRWLWGIFLGFASAVFLGASVWLIVQKVQKDHSVNPAVPTTQNIQKDKNNDNSNKEAETSTNNPSTTTTN
ncbi:hypothetical protein [Mycoplasma sp. 480]|uniref:hypothetical protein n=1 Tax=Mycoplasma sp. 480 TaxID=3440155 RepID=UPI003F51AAA0